MKLYFKALTTAALVFTANAAFSAPANMKLVMHNKTDLESGAYIGGVVKPLHPVKANSTRTMPWWNVKMACTGYAVNNQCTALIKMAINTPSPIELGTVTMDLQTGNITPKVLSANGYTLTVTGVAETTLTKN